ncbi:MAG: copper resistance protein CopZ [Magnetococcales bacterium]|nr:copper resistance protein CopZ [Magnetococcales bacterium]
MPQMLRSILIIFLLVLTACGNPADESMPTVQEPPPEAKGFYCGMSLAEHPGPKGQLHMAGETQPLWFSSVHDAMAYLQLEGATRRIRAFYVHDMAKADWNKPQPGTWIDAQKSWFVLGSKRLGGMGGSEVVPFATQSQAETFAKEHGGRVLDYAAMRKKEMFPAQSGPEK